MNTDANAILHCCQCTAEVCYFHVTSREPVSQATVSRQNLIIVVAAPFSIKMDDVSGEFHLGIDSESETEYVAEEVGKDEEEGDWARVTDPKRFRSTSSSDLEDAVSATRDGSHNPRVVLESASPSLAAREESEEAGSRSAWDAPAEPDDQDQEREVAPIGEVGADERNVPSSTGVGPVGGVSTCLCGEGSRSGMIECGSCGGRYHGDCVGVTRQRAAMLQRFHCPSCMSRDPSLITVFREEGEGGGEERDEPVERVPGPRKRTSNMCGKWRQCGVMARLPAATVHLAAQYTGIWCMC